MNHKPWQAIFDKYKIHNHNFSKEPYVLTAEQIKKATAHFLTTNEWEVRVLCKQDSREDRPDVFIKNNLFLLPIKNGAYIILVLTIRGRKHTPKFDFTAGIFNQKITV
jgi:hypothetical protein